MNKNSFLAQPETQTFINFLANKWEGDFRFILGIKCKRGKANAKYITINSLKEAYENYCWQYFLNEYQGYPFDPTGTQLNQSDAVLNHCQKQLLTKDGSLINNKQILLAASEIILKWGGVSNGNLNHLRTSDFSIYNHYRGLQLLWNNLQEGANFKPLDLKGIKSNAGFTKLHSVILKDFIIYDSRVSVALAYLTELCFGSNIPNHLQWRISPPRNETKHLRPVNSAFKHIRHKQDHYHLHSNILASILLAELRDQLKHTYPHLKLRDIEASLFMVGYDIRNLKI